MCVEWPWGASRVLVAQAGKQPRRPKHMPSRAAQRSTAARRTCISDSMARSLATAMVRPSGSNEAWLTQEATMADLALVWAAVTM